MMSNDDNTNEKSTHPETGNNGSMSAVRVGSRNLPLYPLVVVCLGLLNTILVLSAIVIGVYCGKVREVSTPDQSAHHLILEFKTISEMHTEIIKSQVEAKQALDKELRNQHKFQLQIAQNQTLCDQLQTQIESLHVEKATLQAQISDIQSSCGRCLPGWQLINSTCYFHSIAETTTLKNWRDSRADCIHRGGNLTVIDNLEEQLNLSEFLPKMYRGQNQRSQKGTWIGLTYLRANHSWVWLNEVILHHEGYWNLREPNNLDTPGGACAAILNTKITTKTWFHASCLLEKEWLCEMEPNQL